MEVHLPPEKEERLRSFANRAGKEASEIVEEAVDRMLDNYDERFLAAVKEGEEAMARGDYLTHEEVGERLERLLRS